MNKSQGIIVFLIGAGIFIISEILHLLSNQLKCDQSYVLPLVIGMGLMLYGVMRNRDYYVEKYEEMNPRDRIGEP